MDPPLHAIALDKRLLAPPHCPPLQAKLFKSVRSRCLERSDNFTPGLRAWTPPSFIAPGHPFVGPRVPLSRYLGDRE